MSKLTRWLNSKRRRLQIMLEDTIGEKWAYFTDNGCEMLKERLYYVRRVFYIRLFHHHVWRLAVDMENFLDDIDPWCHLEAINELCCHGLPENMAGAYRYTAVSLFDWDFDYVENLQYWLVEDMEESDADYLRGRDIYNRLEAWKQKKTKPRDYYKYRGKSGKTRKVKLVVKPYLVNNNLFVGLVSKNGWSYNVTVNITEQRPYHATIDVNGPDGELITDWLKKNHIADYVGPAIQSGFVSYPVYKFNPEVLQAHDPRGLEKYKEQSATKRIVKAVITNISLTTAEEHCLYFALSQQFPYRFEDSKFIIEDTVGRPLHIPGHNPPIPSDEETIRAMITEQCQAVLSFFGKAGEEERQSIILIDVEPVSQAASAEEDDEVPF